MITVLKDCDVYAPEHIGIRDILICDGRIAEIRDNIVGFDDLEQANVISLNGAKIAPGYVDIHEHVTGGGGEQGFASRVPEIQLSELTTAGVTTVLGLLGTDGETRSLENLYAKVCALTEEGITAYMLTGSYSFPSKTITGEVMKDIAFIDKVLGVKVAVSDHRSSNITKEELIRLASDARLGGMISGKSGITTIHMGSGKNKMQYLKEILNHSELPKNNLLPTHVGRTNELFMEAVEYGKENGNLDFTADDEGEEITAEQIMEAIKLGVDIERITLSSDACGSIPMFDDKGACIGMTYTLPHVLHRELCILVNKYGLPLEKALMILTKNPADRIGISNKKGRIAVGTDADLLIYDDKLQITDVMAKGVFMVRKREVVKKGRFEK